MKDPRTLLTLGGVFVLSFVAAWVLPVDEFFKGIASVPGVAALIGVLYQLMRDEALHAKQLEIQQQQQLFSLGAMSHMANVTFDKHAQFCEKYMAELHSVITTLFREGPTEEALRHAANLSKIRQEFAAWITKSINAPLEPFEQALRTLGASLGFVVSTQGDPNYAQQRQARVAKVWELFNGILTIEGSPPDEQVAVDTIKERVREILGINELVQLRQSFVRSATALLPRV
jgi:hypothetical protein